MMAETDAHIGKVLYTRRRQLGLTQRAIAEAVGVTFQQVQKYECGAVHLGASRLFEIALAVDLPVGAFFPRQEARTWSTGGQ